MKLRIFVAALAAGFAFATAADAQSPQTPPKPKTVPSMNPAPEQQSPFVQPGSPAAANSAVLDINSATIEELDALPGIGAARADAIVKGRPYKAKDELVQKNILPAGVYDKVKDKLIAKQKTPDAGAKAPATKPAKTVPRP